MADITNQPPDPLRINVRIVDQEGKPTQEFLRQWNQQRVINVTVDDIVVDLTALQADVTVLEAEVDDIQDVDIVAGVGLDGGGNISGPTDVTLDLADTAVTPGTYGNATNSAQVTIDQQGRITAAANIPITGGGGGSGSGGSGGGTVIRRALVSRSAALSGLGSGTTEITWDNQVYDDDGFFAPSSTDFVIPAAYNGSRARFWGTIRANNISGGQRFAVITFKNGATLTGSGGGGTVEGAADGTQPGLAFSTAWVDVATNDTFSVAVFTNDGSWDLNTGSSFFAMEIEVV